MSLATVENGLPTEPDVAKLMEYYGTLAPGMRIEYAEVATLIRAEVRSNRWKGVTDRWRHQLAKQEIYLMPHQARRWVVRSPEERGLFQSYHKKRSYKHMARAVKIAAGIPLHELSPETRRDVEHTLANAAKFELAKSTRPKPLPPIDPSPSK